MRIRPHARSLAGLLVAAVAGCTYARYDLPEPQVGGLIQVLTPNPLLLGYAGRVQVQLFTANLGMIEGVTVSLRASLADLPDAFLEVIPAEVVTDVDGLSEIATVSSNAPGVVVVNATVEPWGIELAPVLLRFTADPAQTMVNAPSRSFATGAGPTAVVVGDVNGDDLLDVVTADLNSMTLSVLFGDGRGDLALESRLDSRFSPADVILVDYDGDGDTDILYVTPADPRLGVFEQQADGRLTRSMESSVGYPRALAVVDFGATTFVDVVVVAANRHQLLHYPASAVRFGAPFVVHDLVGLGPVALAVGDLDGDGRDDVVVANVGSNDLTLLTNPDDLDAAFLVATTQAPVAVAVYDLDADGALDIVAVGAAGTPPELAIHFHRDDGYHRADRPLCDGANAVAVGDLNIDGFPDIAVTCGVSGILRVFLGDARAGNGETDKAYEIFADIEVGGWPMDLALADLDQDDALDIIIADFAANGVTVLLGGSGITGL